MILKVLQYILHGVNKWFDVEHHTKSFDQRPVMSTYRRKWETCHWCMQASWYWRGVSKSTSWMMCWCRQEATRCRRALMYSTSMTWNEVNDFGDENWLTTQGLGMVVMKMKVYGIAKDEVWTEWLLLNMSTTLRWIGSVDPKQSNGWYDRPTMW